MQREEFKRLGVVGDWEHPYLTMSYPAEATIARELMKFAANGLLYRGSKPVMWSVVEKTALAEAEVEYQDYQCDAIWVKFPVEDPASAAASRTLSVVDLDHDAVDDPRQPRHQLLVQDRLRPLRGHGRAGEQLGEGRRQVHPRRQARRRRDEVRQGRSLRAPRRCEAPTISRDQSARIRSHALGYDFDVPLLDGDHVTDDTGTGFVHTAPGHGADDYIIWIANQKALRDRGIDTTIPFTVDADGVLTKEAPGFEGKRVLKENGDKGDANDAVIKALSDAGNIIARGRLKHQYPHSWRSKKPIIFRNTPQWFIAMDKPFSLAPLRGGVAVRGSPSRSQPRSGDGDAAPGRAR